MKRYSASTGSATPTAILFVMVSMLITVGYLKYSLTTSAMERYRFAETQALYLAETGLNKEAVPVLPFISSPDSMLLSGQRAYTVDGKKMGDYENIRVGVQTGPNGESIYFGEGTGVASYKGPDAKLIEVRRRARLMLQPMDFSKWMYLTNTEEPGGGPYTDGTVNFGPNDALEGRIHTNGHITMSTFGCPSFAEGSKVVAVNGFSLNGCNYDEDILDPTAPVDSIEFPPGRSVEITKSKANWVYTGDDLLFRGALKDTLIMTQIEFVSGGFKVSQWTYLIPPVAVDGPPPTEFVWDTGGSASGISSGRANFNLPFSNVFGYANSDTLIISDHDANGSSISAIMTQYSVGDSILVTSKDTITKFWGGFITSKVHVGNLYIIGVGTWSQSFVGGGFVDGEGVELSYKAPLDQSLAFNNFAYYHNHSNNRFSHCKADGFHNFDFEPGIDGPDVMPERMVYADQGVIYVQNGQVRIKGVVDGNFTIVTDEYTEYRRHDDPTIIDRVYDNIWLIDDIYYADSDPFTGEVAYPSANRLGLVSGANIIIANTAANGARNRANGQDIVINAALLALKESFVAHYWQNTVTDPALYGPNMSNFNLSKGDGRGPFRNPNQLTPSTTGQSDIRGVVHFWGSISQAKRGYMKRNNPGPYNVFPGIGYDKDYHYDYNFSDFYGPIHFPVTSGTDGGVNLTMKSYGEIPSELPSQNTNGTMP